jgi:hypothetical protein
MRLSLQDLRFSWRCIVLHCTDLWLGRGWRQLSGRPTHPDHCSLWTCRDFHAKSPEFLCGDYENSYMLERDARQSGRTLPTFRVNILPECMASHARQQQSCPSWLRENVSSRFDSNWRLMATGQVLQPSNRHPQQELKVQRNNQQTTHGWR